MATWGDIGGRTDKQMDNSLDHWLSTPPEENAPEPTMLDYLSDILGVLESMESNLQGIDNQLDTLVDILQEVLQPSPQEINRAIRKALHGTKLTD